MTWVRFIGDSIGYNTIVPIFTDNLPNLGWMQANIGIQQKVVWIDVSKAYMIENAQEVM